MNILLVEDEKIQRQALASIIKENFIDVRIYEAGSIDEAIKLINEKDINLFFIDINLNNSSDIAATIPTLSLPITVKNAFIVWFPLYIDDLILCLFLLIVKHDVYILISYI